MKGSSKPSAKRRPGRPPKTPNPAGDDAGISEKIRPKKQDDNQDHRASGDPNSESPCATRMVALLQANAIASDQRLVASAGSAYTFELLTINEQDDGPMFQKACVISAMVCSQYYSRMEWALGTVDGDAFKLSMPLQFRSTVQLMNHFHSQPSVQAGKAVKLRVPQLDFWVAFPAFTHSPGGGRVPSKNSLKDPNPHFTVTLHQTLWYYVYLLVRLHNHFSTMTMDHGELQTTY